MAQVGEDGDMPDLEEQDREPIAMGRPSESVPPLARASAGGSDIMVIYSDQYKFASLQKKSILFFYLNKILPFIKYFDVVKYFEVDNICAMLNVVA